MKLVENRAYMKLFLLFSSSFSMSYSLSALVNLMILSSCEVILVSSMVFEFLVCARRVDTVQ